MGHQRYAPEFKDEAVRQVIERGHPVTQMAARLGVSSHSLYKWVMEGPATSSSRRRSVCDRTEPTSTSVHRRSVGLGLGDRHNIHPDVGGMALSGCGDGSAQPQDRGLVDAADTGTRHCCRRAIDGGVEA